MIKELLNDLSKIPNNYSFKDIQDFNRMEERFYDVDANFTNILGWNADSLDFCPNDEPPKNDEILAWLWVIHPEWKNEILEFADEKLKKIIKEYEEYEP